MPKIKDLGIKVIPETMQPPRADGGGGCVGGTFPCACTAVTPCLCSAHPTIAPCPLHTICLCSHLPTVCHFGTCGGCSIAITHPCLCTHIASIPCGLSGGCGYSPVCGGSIDPTIVQQPEITHEQIAALKDQLHKQIAALDEYAKTIGPRTADEIDAREKQLNEELTRLKARRKDIEKK